MSTDETVYDLNGLAIIGAKKPDPIVTDQKALHRLSRITNWDEIRELNLVERLKASNATAWTKGVGLAAVQIGVYIRAAWFNYEGTEHVLVNPIITKATNPVIVPKEGCLSVPGSWVATRRYGSITVKTEGENGIETLDFTGFVAIVVQHEIDHMYGILNFQRRYIPIKVTGRNEPCPCGSGLKYKKCCIDKLQQPTKPKEEKDDAGDISNNPKVAPGEDAGDAGK